MKAEDSIKTNKKNYSETVKIEKNNVICKDGFCTIPNVEGNSNIQNPINDNLFEPI